MILESDLLGKCLMKALLSIKSQFCCTYIMGATHNEVDFRKSSGKEKTYESFASNRRQLRYANLRMSRATQNFKTVIICEFMEKIKYFRTS